MNNSPFFFKKKKKKRDRALSIQNIHPFHKEQIEPLDLPPQPLNVTRTVRIKPSHKGFLNQK
jgi:hypothetical protein